MLKDLSDYFGFHFLIEGGKYPKLNRSKTLSESYEII